MLEANPGRVQEVIEVPVPRPRSMEQAISPEFLATKQHVEALIHPPPARGGDELPMLRMTRVDDDVE